MRAFAGRMRYLVDANDAMLIAGGGHWAHGSADPGFGGTAALAPGLWRIAAVDGVAPPVGERPPELAVGAGVWGLWDGCMHSEGVSIETRRWFFTRGSGLVSMAFCPDVPVRRAINGVVGAGPRVAKTDDGVAPVSPVGALRLVRTSARAFGGGADMRLRDGRRFDLLLPGGAARLAIGPGDRWTLATDCGTVTGRWRADRSAAGPYARFGPDGPPASCAAASSGLRAYEFFTGDVRSAVGPNEDIALFVNRDEAIYARVAGR